MKSIFLTLTLVLFVIPFTGVAQSEQRYANGTATDQDGNVFEWINYGAQDWAIENAEVVTYRDGTEIPQVTDDTQWANLTTGAWCYYGNDPSKGKLYNWYAVVGIHDTDPNTPNKEFAPEGWKIPSNIDVNDFYNFLTFNYHCSQSSSTETNWISKSIASKTNWNQVSNTAEHYLCTPGYNPNDNNVSGFNLMPNGNRQSDGMFSGEGSYGLLISKTEFDDNSVYNRVIFYNGVYMDGWYANPKRRGSTVRFVRDASSEDTFDILLNGTVSAENHQIKNVADPTHSQDVTTKKYVDSKTSEILNSQNFSNNSQIGLTGVVYDFEGNRYETVIMCDGKQWTTQYLNVSHFANGEQIPEVTGNEAWRDLTTPAWCYSYNQDNDRGKIYNGFALTDERGLAPEGWHIATEEEWNDLIECLGGTEVAGGKLKISGTQYWTSPNVGSGATGKASNSSGMSLLPDGFREGANGNFYSENEFVSIWNYSNIPDRRPFVHLLNDKAEISKGLTDPYDGAHILLVKD